MDVFTILAQTTNGFSESGGGEIFEPVDLFWNQIINLSLVEAITFISFGTVCLLYGWRVFKILVVICFAILGLTLGIIAAEKIGGEDQRILGGIAGLVILAILAVPLMKWAVSVLGAVAGGVLTSGLWYACGLPEQYIWAGGLIGFVAGGMVAFIGFKIAVMLFSSLGGASLVVTGVLAMLYLHPSTQNDIQKLIFEEKWFIPTVLSIPTVFGMLIQNKFIKKSPEWSMPEEN